MKPSDPALRTRIRSPSASANRDDGERGAAHLGGPPNMKGEGRIPTSPPVPNGSTTETNGEHCWLKLQATNRLWNGWGRSSNGTWRNRHAGKPE